MFQFDFELFLHYILKKFQLDGIAQRKSVELSITLDGAELCNGISHLVMGIKLQMVERLILRWESHFALGIMKLLTGFF
jgi:hypothetical protein